MTRHREKSLMQGLRSLAPEPSMVDKPINY